MSDSPIPVEVQRVAAYDPVAAGLADLRARFADATFDCATTAGDKAARAARLELVRLRSALEAKRKEIKAPALAYSRLIDSEASRIEGEILALELPIDTQIKAEEERKAAAKAAREEAERARIAGIRRSIELACLVGVMNRKCTRTALEEALAAVQGLQFGEECGELLAEAEVVREREIRNLGQLLAERIQADEDEARLAAEKAELERKRAEQEAAAKAERERLAAEREENERRAAEARIAQEARLAEERAKLEAERAELERQREERARKEREAKAAEEAKAAAAKAEAERVERERQAAQSTLEKAAPAMREALETVRCDSAWGALSSDTRSAVEHAIRQATWVPRS